MVLLTCYNNACSAPNREFDPKENHETACCFHPGLPVFHEGLKGWTCCKRRVTCFDEMLNMKGCTNGPHSNVKKETKIAKSEREQAGLESGLANKIENTSNQLVKNLKEGKATSTAQVADEAANLSEKYIQAPPTQEAMDLLKDLRPDVNDPKISLPVQALGSLKKGYEKAHKLYLENKENNKKLEMLSKDKNLSAQDLKIEEGTVCCRKGCKETYPALTDCVHHPGIEVFHEGCKYWSCCQRVTSDFNSFLNQVGCTTTDEHLWVEPLRVIYTNL